ncbi:MAG: hypothetical protein U0167_07830 [bacterium]
MGMRSEARRRRARVIPPWAAGGLLVLVLSRLAGCSCGHASCTARGTPDDALVGAWRSSVQFDDGTFAPIRDLEFLYAFNVGGTMTESSNYDGVPPVPPAYGVWRAAGTNRFDATYTFYTTKAPARLDELAAGGGWLPAGRGVLTEHITLASDGQSYESTLTLDLYDKDGKPIAGGGRAAGRGKRIRF